MPYTTIPPQGNLGLVNANARLSVVLSIKVNDAPVHYRILLPNGAVINDVLTADDNHKEEDVPQGQAWTFYNDSHTATIHVNYHPLTMHSSPADTQTELAQVLSGLPWADAFSLGAGVDAIKGGVAGSAVEPFTPQQSSSIESTERYNFVQSDSDLEQEIDVAASGSYNIDGVTVSASTSYLNKIKFSELSMTIVAEYSAATIDYDEVSSYSLTSAAKALLATPAAFRNAYGDYFISGGKRGSRFVAVFSCQSVSVESLDAFKAGFGADAPDVFSAEGSAKFQKSASDNRINLSVDLFMEGHNGKNPPNGPWTPSSIVDALKWFKNNQAPRYVQAKLRHYSTIDPTYSRTLPIPPAVFVDLRLLYSKVWDVRSRYAALPDYYQTQFVSQYRKIDYGVCRRHRRSVEN